MKFLSTFSKFCIFSLLFVGVTSAATGTVWDRIDTLSSGTAFGYTSTQKISISQITSSNIVITSPVIQDDLGNTLKEYTVTYSQYPLSQLEATPALLDQTQEKTFDFTTLGSTITMQLNAVTDALNPTKVYYIFVAPKDQNGVMGQISNEIWANLAMQTTGDGLYTAGIPMTHASAGSDMNLANVTCTYSSRTATCRRTAINGSDTVDIMLRDPNTEVFNKLATVNMSAERYAFTISRNGEYLLDFVPNNSGREKRYTFTVSGIGGTTPTSPTIKTVPHVGPTENILVVLFIAFVLYLLYRRATVNRK